MPLTASQRATLRGFAMQRDDDISIGRHGITDNVVKEIDQLLTKQELVKIRFNSKDAMVRGQLLAELSGMLQAEVAGTVGRTAALYRYSPKVEKHLIKSVPAS